MFRNLISLYDGFDIKIMRYDGLLKKLNDSFKKKTNLVSKKNGWVKINYCDLCNKIHGKIIKNNENKIVAKKYGTIYYECNSCNIFYANRIPKNIIEDVYSDLNYLKQAKSSYLDNVEYRKKRFGFERIKLILKYLKNNDINKSILDVGCGTGWFLEIAKKEFSKVYGLEPSISLSKDTEERLKIKIFKKDLINQKFNFKFDVITMFDVIEHVPNPLEYIKKAYKILNKHGILVIFTPNNDSYGMDVLKSKSTHICPPDHLYVFNNKSIKNIFDKIGFKVIHYSTKGSDIADIFMRLKQTEKKIEIADFLSKNSNKLQAILDKAKCANHMRHIVVKN